MEAFKCSNVATCIEIESSNMKFLFKLYELFLKVLIHGMNVYDCHNLPDNLLTYILFTKKLFTCIEKSNTIYRKHK